MSQSLQIGMVLVLALLAANLPFVNHRVLLLGPLRAAGHTAHAVTLTGTGERAHLRHPGIGMAVPAKVPHRIRHG